MSAHSQTESDGVEMFSDPVQSEVFKFTQNITKVPKREEGMKKL